MQVGETARATIDAREHWNRTGIHVDAGGRYRATAEGEWHDAGKNCDADGWKSDSDLIRDLEMFRRVRHADWFALIGAIDEDRESEFVIGRQVEFTASRDGELTCFANDAPFMYWNNKGSVTLTVTRLA
jgi:hypothetical protein